MTVTIYTLFSVSGHSDFRSVSRVHGAGVWATGEEQLKKLDVDQRVSY